MSSQSHASGCVFVICRQPSDGRSTWMQGQYSNHKDQSTSMLRPSAPTTSMLQSTSSQNTQISPETLRRTYTQKQSKKTEVRQ